MDTIWTPALATDKPKYRALYDAIKNAVEADELGKNTKLPPIRELAFRIKVTPATVARAYQMAIEDGTLEARKGDGTYVRKIAGAPSPLKPDEALVNGYNLYARATPDVGQTALANREIARIANDGGFRIQTYANNIEIRDLRDLMAHWLQRDGIHVEADDLVITRGAANAAVVSAMAMRLHSGMLKGLIDPISYTGFRDIEFAGLCKYEVVEGNSDGVDLASLEKVAHAARADFYVTSSVALNPFSVTLSDERMAEVAAVARAEDFQIIDDIIYSHSLKTRRKTLRDYAPERVWTVTSLSKLGYPGLDTGVLIPPPGRASEVSQLMSALNISPNLLQLPVVEAVMQSSEFWPLVEKMRDEIAARQEIARRVLAGFDFQMAEGAPFLWLHVPEQVALSQFMSILETKNVRCAASDVFTNSKEIVNAVRLTLGGAHSREVFEDALKRVREVLEMEVMERVI